jgi:hypothetical protein
MTMAKKKTFPTGNRKMAPKRKRADRARRSKRTGPLAAWLKTSELSLTEFAGRVKIDGKAISVQHVSNLVHGHTAPSRVVAVAIEEATGGAVSVSSWS